MTDTDYEPDEDTLAQTENFEVWVSHEAGDDEPIYHVDTGRMTLHFFPEEWDEFVKVITQASGR